MATVCLDKLVGIHAIDSRRLIDVKALAAQCVELRLTRLPEAEWQGESRDQEMHEDIFLADTFFPNLATNTRADAPASFDCLSKGSLEVRC